MRNISVGVDVTTHFPIYAIENDFIINKAAEITAAYRVDLPEVFTVSAEEYERIHGVWLKAIKVLPNYSILHKQDWFTKENYHHDAKDTSFLSTAYGKHFEGRSYLSHTCYLFLTKTRKGRRNLQSIDSLLLKKNIIPTEYDRKSLIEFSDIVDQFERIINDCGLFTISRLKGNELIEHDGRPGILEKHMNLSQKEAYPVLQDKIFEGGTLRIGDNTVCLFSIASADVLPEQVSTDCVYSPLSTDKSDCNLSFAAPLGLLLDCDHMLNQYVFIDNSGENLRNLEADGRKMGSLSRISSSNEINKAYIDAYIESAKMHHLTSVKAHCNIMAWSESEEELHCIKNNIGSALSTIGCGKVRNNTVDGPVLFWASIPGNEGDFPREETYLTFPENAMCFFTEESNYRNHSNADSFGVWLSDRISGKPVHVDLSEKWMKDGVIKNRNKFVLGGSGGGKSFFMNHLMRQYYEQDSHIILVDMGNSYQGLCSLINSHTKGNDGIYYTYSEENPIAFNPFYTDDGVYELEKRDSLKTLIISLWKREGGKLEPSEDVAVENAVSQYIKKIQSGKVRPCFNTFYEFVQDEFDVAPSLTKLMEEQKVEVKNLFDVVNFLHVLSPFYKGGTYDYLLNSDKDLDLLNKRFIVFEIDQIRDNKVLFPVVTLVIMESYINKMRRLKGIRKVLVLEEAWKAIAKEGMAEYVKYLYKTVRKYFGEIIVVTQEMDDIISSQIVKESIIANADCKILLDLKDHKNKFDKIQTILGLTEKDKNAVLSINQNLNTSRKYKEVWIGLGGKKSTVYATEVSPSEYYTYTTEEREKMEVNNLTTEFGDLEKAIRTISGYDKQ